MYGLATVMVPPVPVIAGLTRIKSFAFVVVMLGVAKFEPFAPSVYLQLMGISTGVEVAIPEYSTMVDQMFVLVLLVTVTVTLPAFEFK